MIKKLTFLILALVLFCSFDLAACKDNKKIASKQKQTTKKADQPVLAYAYFGGGCFWCVQAMFEDLKGVSNVESGYSGGFVDNPEYKQVKKGKTGHAQVIKITYNPKVISFKELLYIFMHAHDPTTYHRQGIDSGPQYRSVVYFQTQEELRITKSLLKQIERDASYTGYPQPILTEVALFGKFYPAQQYHQDYFSANPYDQECSSIIAPKVQKIKKLFKDYFQPEL